MRLRVRSASNGTSEEVDEGVSRFMDSMEQGIEQASLREAVNKLAREVASLRGLNPETDGPGIAEDTITEARGELHQQNAQRGLGLAKKFAERAKDSK